MKIRGKGAKKKRRKKGGGRKSWWADDWKERGLAILKLWGSGEGLIGCRELGIP